MKSIYWTLFAFCVVVLGLGLLVSFAPTPEESLVADLRQDADNWRIEIIKPTLTLRDPARTQEQLTAFLRKHGRPTDVFLIHCAQLLAVVALFSGMGWYREINWERRSQLAIGPSQ